MTNREAIEYLNDVRNGIHIPAPGIELPLLNDKEKEAVDLAISALEKQEQDRWIPVTERPPEKKKKVLVSYDTEDGKRVDISMFDKYGYLLGLVSAWRPIPEPYQEDEA